MKNSYFIGLYDCAELKMKDRTFHAAFLLFYNSVSYVLGAFASSLKSSPASAAMIALYLSLSWNKLE